MPPRRKLRKPPQPAAPNFWHLDFVPADVVLIGSTVSLSDAAARVEDGEG
eukprot:gene54194-45409_t